MNDQFLTRFLKSYMPGGEQYEKKAEYLKAISEMFSENELEMYIKATELNRPFTFVQFMQEYESSNFEQTLEHCLNKYIIRMYHDGSQPQKYIASTLQEVHEAYLRDSVTNKHFTSSSLLHAINDYVLEAINVGDRGRKIPTPNHMKNYKIMLGPGHAKRIKMDTDIPDRRSVETTNDVIKLIKNQAAFAFAPCSCRVASEAIEGYHCKRIGQCIFFNEIALHYIAIGQGKEISMQEAINFVLECGKKGLVHMTENVNEKAYVLCNCCNCCCMTMKSVQRGEIHTVMASKYKPVYNSSECIQCGKCIRICPGHAIQLKEGHINIDYEKCIGCGNCSTQCVRNAIFLELRENYMAFESKYNHYNELK